MQKVFLTGMSGVGKSSVIQSLRKMGFDAVDMDDIGWSSFNDAGHQIWNEGRLQHALNSAVGDAFFVAGCAENQVRFYPLFTRIVLLSAPWAVMVERIMSDTSRLIRSSYDGRSHPCRWRSHVECLSSHVAALHCQKPCCGPNSQPWDSTSSRWIVTSRKPAGG